MFPSSLAERWLDVVLRAQLAELLAPEPDEPQLVERMDLAHLLGDVQDRGRARAVVEHAGAVDRVEVRVDDHDVARVAALGLRDDVPVGAVRVDDLVDAQVHDRRRAGRVLVVKALADLERRERHRDARHERVAVRVHHAAAEHGRAARVALIEDDDADCSCGLGIEHLHAEIARAALDQGDLARE